MPERTDFKRYSDAHAMFIMGFGKLGEALLKEVGDDLQQAMELMNSYRGKYLDQKAFVRNISREASHLDQSTAKTNDDSAVQDVFSSGKFLFVEVDGLIHVFERNRSF